MVQVFQELTESEDGYMLHEIEANSFLPYLINKMGDPKVGEVCQYLYRYVK